MLPHYLALDGIEIISTPRAEAYAESGECGVTYRCSPCDLAAAEWLHMGEPYISVAADPAPWFDPAIPESAGVHGFAGFQVAGAMSAQRASGSSATSSASGAVRELEFEVDIFTADECSRSYALGWLATILDPSPCDDSGCIGRVACMLACCPDIGEDGEATNDPLRYMMDVETISGPTETAVAYGPGVIVTTVTFVLRTTNVYMYREPAPDRRFMVRPSDGQRVTIDLPAVYAACEDVEPCLEDPNCPDSRFADLPAEPLPECYPAEPFEAHRTVLAIPSSALPASLDVIPVIRVAAGNRPIRNFVARFYQNPFDLPCDRLGEMNPCRACTDLTVTWIPPGGSMVLDGRTGRNTVTCGTALGGQSTEPVTVYGPPIEGVGAGAIEPIACGGGLCIEIYAAVGISPNASVTVELWTRQNGG